MSERYVYDGDVWGDYDYGPSHRFEGYMTTTVRDLKGNIVAYALHLSDKDREMNDREFARDFPDADLDPWSSVDPDDWV